MNNLQNNNAVPALRVWHVPQVLCPAFHVVVDSVAEGVRIMAILASYDEFQHYEGIRGDFSNASGLEMWYQDNGTGKPGWVTWFDPITGEDDPDVYLEEIGKLLRTPTR